MKALSLLAVLLVAGCKKAADVPQDQPAPVVTQNISDKLPAWNLKQESIDPPPAAQFNGPRLGDILVGKTVWIQPYTIWVASPGDGLPNKIFVNGFHNYYESPQPKTLQITRENDGWIVDLHGTEQEWTAMKFPGFQGGGYDSQPVRFRH